MVYVAFHPRTYPAPGLGRDPHSSSTKTAITSILLSRKGFHMALGDAWHFPGNPEPFGNAGMRDPVFPTDPVSAVTVLISNGQHKNVLHCAWARAQVELRMWT